MNLLLMFFLGPAWVPFLLAAAVAAFGWKVYADTAALGAARQALLSQAPPATGAIDTAEGRAPDRTPQDVSVSAQIGLAHNTRLVRRTSGIKTDEDLLHVLFAPDAGADETAAAGAIIIDPEDLDAFVDWVTGQTTGAGALGPIVRILRLRTSEGEASHAYEAMDEDGLTRTDGFFCIAPSVAGREAALSAPWSETYAGRSMILAGIAALAGVAVATGQTRVFNLVPLVFVAGFRWAMRKGGRLATAGVDGLTDRLFGRPGAAAATAPAGRRAARVDDGFADSPVKAGGMGLSGLIARLKPVPKEAEDPFARLTAMVQAERKRETPRPLRPAE